MHAVDLPASCFPLGRSVPADANGVVYVDQAAASLTGGRRERSRRFLASIPLHVSISASAGVRPFAGTAWLGAHAPRCRPALPGRARLLTSALVFAYARYVRPPILFVAALAWDCSRAQVGLADAAGVESAVASSRSSAPAPRQGSSRGHAARPSVILPVRAGARRRAWPALSLAGFLAGRPRASCRRRLVGITEAFATGTLGTPSSTHDPDSSRSGVSPDETFPRCRPWMFLTVALLAAALESLAIVTIVRLLRREPGAIPPNPWIALSLWTLAILSITVPLALPPPHYACPVYPARRSSRRARA